MSGAAWHVLGGLPAWDVTEIPRAPRPRAADARPEGPAPSRVLAQRTLALAAAWAEGAPVAFGWLRERAGGPVRVIAAGPGLTAEVDGTKDGGEVLLTVPAGARGRPLGRGGAGEAFAVLPAWVPVAITTDALLADGEKRDAADQTQPLPLDDVLLPAWTGPFGWLVLAAPVSRARLEELTSQTALAQLTAQRHDSPRAQIAARRATARHDELGRAATTGLWDVWLLAGSRSKAAAARVAGLVASAADLEQMPYRLTTMDAGGALPALLGAASAGAAQGPLARSVGEMQRAAQGEVTRGGINRAPPPAWTPRNGDYPEALAEFPCAASSGLLAVLAQPPSQEVPGIRFALRPDFDVTPEISDGGIELGVVLDRNKVPSGVLSVPRDSLNRHVFVCGATGGGKSQTVRHLLESVTRAGIPWLVIEPAKAEYRLMAARLPGTDVVTIRPGDLDAVPAGVNPLEPAAGPDGSRFPLQAHADLVRSLFLAAFEADEPFPQVLAAALTRCYEQAGWDLVTGQPAVPGAAYPGLTDLQDAAMRIVEEIGYGQEVTDNVRGFVRVRIGSLRTGTSGRFLDGAFPLNFAKLLASNVVLEIEDCGGDADKAFLTGTVIIRLTEHLRMVSRFAPMSPGLRHLTVVEEAHRLLRQPPPGEGSGPAAHAVEMFAGLLAEIRAYGEGLVIAEQIPAKLIPDVIKNTAVKVVHRLPAQDDRDAVGATMNLTEDQSAYLVTLTPGDAAVFSDGMDYPLLVRMPDGSSRERHLVARPASPRALVGERDAACPASCQASPCTLARLSAARAVLAGNPRIRLWAELAVAGHLGGWLMPTPGPELSAEIYALEPRLRDCAVAQAVSEAVAVRVPAMAARVSATALAAHVAAGLRAAVNEERWACHPREPQWLAPAVTWSALAADLRLWEQGNPGGGPHPQTALWQEALGRVIPGATVAEQAVAVERWAAADPPGRADWHAIVFGSRVPSAIEVAARTTARDPDRDARLAAMLGAFADAEWTMAKLRMASPEESA